MAREFEREQMDLQQVRRVGGTGTLRPSRGANGRGRTAAGETSLTAMSPAERGLRIPGDEPEPGGVPLPAGAVGSRQTKGAAGVLLEGSGQMPPSFGDLPGSLGLGA